MDRETTALRYGRADDDIQSRLALQEMFVRLEKDFKYNLTLLKIRETEIERCTETNRTLQEALAACLKANGELKSRIGLLETALDRSSADREKDRETHRETTTELMKSLGESKRERDLCRQDREVEVQTRIFEVEKNYVELLNRRQAEWEKKNEETQNKLEAEIMMVAKLRNQVENGFEETSALRNKLREAREKYSRESSAYLNELNTLRNSNDTLNSTITALRREATSQRSQCDFLKRRLRDYADRVEGQLAARIDSLTKENDALKSANAAALMNCKNEKEKLTMHIDERKIEDGRVTEGVKVPSGDVQINCRISEHRRYSLLAKQNEVLQEIVKTMRKERETLNEKQKEELRRAEARVEKLENVIDSMKRVAVLNVEIPNGIPTAGLTEEKSVRING